MSYCFNKINNKVLTFDCFKDIEKIRFNHYIMRKENLNRLKGEFPKGQFTMTISTVMKDLNLSKSKAERIIRDFEKLGIIKSIIKGNLAKGYSIYEYVTSDKDDEKGNKKVKDVVEASDDEVFEDIDDKDNEKRDSKDFVNSKKENIKRELNKNNIYNAVIDYLNEKTGKNFRATTQKTKNFIDARLREDFCEDDFYKVIDVKCYQWLYSDMAKFLRPETLFSNKFEGYLNEVVVIISEIEDDIERWDIEFDF